jgi:hypothetical protein
LFSRDLRRHPASAIPFLAKGETPLYIMRTLLYYNKGNTLSTHIINISLTIQPPSPTIHAKDSHSLLSISTIHFHCSPQNNLPYPFAQYEKIPVFTLFPHSLVVKIIPQSGLFPEKPFILITGSLEKHFSKKSFPQKVRFWAFYSISNAKFFCEIFFI